MKLDNLPFEYISYFELTEIVTQQGYENIDNLKGLFRKVVNENIEFNLSETVGNFELNLWIKDFGYIYPLSNIVDFRNLSKIESILLNIYEKSIKELL